MKRLFIIIILLSLSCAEDKRESLKVLKPPEVKKSVKKVVTSKPLLPYKIVEREDISYKGTPRLVMRVLVEVQELPNQDELKRISNSIWASGNTRWAEFTVFLYLPEMNIHSTAYGVGEYRPNGLKFFKIQDFALYNTKWLKTEKD